MLFEKDCQFVTIPVSTSDVDLINKHRNDYERVFINNTATIPLKMAEDLDLVFDDYVFYDEHLHHQMIEDLFDDSKHYKTYISAMIRANWMGQTGVRQRTSLYDSLFFEYEMTQELISADPENGILVVSASTHDVPTGSPLIVVGVEENEKTPVGFQETLEAIIKKLTLANDRGQYDVYIKALRK